MITRLYARRLLKPLLSAAVVLAMSGSALGQTAITSMWTGLSSGSWAPANAWDVAPVSGGDTTIVLAGLTNTITTMDLASPFAIANMQTDTSAANGFTVNGGSFSFTPSSDQANVPTGITVNSNKVFKLNSPLLINNPITFTLAGNDTQGAELLLGGAITGTSAVTVLPGATNPATNMVIRSANNTGFGGTWTVSNSSSTMLGAPNALFRRTAVTLTNSANSLMFSGTTTAADVQNVNGIGDRGFNQQLGSLAGSGQFLMGTSIGAGAPGQAAASSTVLVGFLNGNQTLNGSATLSGVNELSHFGKVGTGNLTIRSSNASFNAGISVRDGNLIIDTSGVSIGAYSGTVASQYTVYSGAQMRLNNATAIDAVVFPQGRLGNLVNPVTAGGTFRFDGSIATNLSNTEVVGALTPYAGFSVIAVNANGATSGAVLTTGLTFASLNVGGLARGGQIGFAGNNIGLGASGNAAVLFTDATAVTTSVIGGILPYAVAQTNYASQATALITFLPDTFATYDAVAGVRALTTFDGNNVLATGAVAPVGAINSLIIGAGGSASLSGAVTSGAVLSRISGGTVSGTLTTTNRGYFSAPTGASLNVTAAVTAAGLSTSGAVSLAGVSLTGTSPVLSVNSGVTTLTAPVTGTTVVFQVTRTGTLTAASGLTVNGTLRGNGTVNGNVTISSGGLIGGTSLAGDNGAGQAPGTLTINGGLTLAAGANFRFYINSVYGDTDGSTTNGQHTQAKINATSLDLTGATPGSITIQPWSLDLKNSAGNAPIYDFQNTVDYLWVLGTYPTITGFDSNKFTVNTAFQNFSTNNPLGAGFFEVIQQGNNLVLHFNPVPEPALLGLGALGLAMIARRRKA